MDAGQRDLRSRGEMAVRLRDPADVRLHAGEMALTIAQIASSQHTSRTLTRELAEYLVAALAAQAAALFTLGADERSGRPQLLVQAAATPQGAAPDTMIQHLKGIAYQALATHRLVQWPRDTGTMQLDPARHSAATPLGHSRPWAVCAVTWGAPPSASEQGRAEIFALVAPALAAATRSGQLLDEATHDEMSRAPQHAAAFALTSEAIASVGEDFIIQETNPAFDRLMGWPEGAAVGMRCSAVLCCRDERKLLLCGTPRCPLEQAFAVEDELPIGGICWQTRGGALCEMSASITAHRFSNESHAVFVARDVSALNTANRMRANFISMVSHELRTPLNSLSGFLEIVTDGQAGPLNPQQQEFLNYARLSAEQLTTLVKDILLLSKADAGQFTLRIEEVDVPKLVHQTVQGLQSAAEKRGITIEANLASGLPTIWADALRLQQVLNNLLNNAIKFSPEGGTACLQIWVDGANLCFSVRDAGDGIPAEDHARIFEQFYQSDNSARLRTGGYGLGLAIARLIVEQHGGRIWVESEPGLGATFAFIVPLQSPPAC
jgi:nitrogen-specific signal transduction histidine kinase